MNTVENAGAEHGQPEPLCILHLEDNAVDAELMARTLQSADIPCRITRVEDEASFVTALRTRRIDLVLSDSGVPGFSGLAALRLIRELEAGIPFAMVSGSVDDELRTDSLWLGAEVCLTKDRLAELIFLARRIWQKASDHPRDLSD